MVQYSIASSRTDGALNRVVMNGKPGYLGYSSVRLSYLENGWIAITGDNKEENDVWKLLSTFTLEPGTYTLTGMSGLQEKTIALQLHIEDDTGNYHYFFQYDEDVTFKIEQKMTATLHIRVYPDIADIDVKARPAVYKDE